ncbi:MAG TPA: SDR family oxidoreductase [Aeromicrobium sp.]|nr:SDR family oxidoreductase [Aeromicrobium sp.]
MGRGSLNGKVVAITGAGSGIGRALAQLAAERNAKLALSDWNEIGLAETVASLPSSAEVTSAKVDVADRAGVAAWAAEVADHFGTVNMIVNNAGVSMTGDFLEMSYEEFDWIVGINFTGVVTGTKEFLPHLIASGDGYLVNISSVFGLISMPQQSAYNATKYAVRGFTEAIREEMIIGRHPVGVTCVHPGGIRTGIARNGRKVASLDSDELDRTFDKIARMTPEKAARIILDGALAHKPRVLVGMDAHAMHQFAKFAGARYQDVFARGATRMMPAPKR